MIIVNNPDNSGMMCVLPNGVTVEVEVVNMEGSSSSNEHDVEQVRNIVDALPESFTHPV